MKQKVFTPTYVDDLKDRVAENMAKYRDPNYSWETDANTEIRELEFEAPDLSAMTSFSRANTDDDFEAAKILFLAYKDLSPLEASHRNLWQYLSHVTLYDYMHKRWHDVEKEDCAVSYVEEHWFYKQNRNWLEGLYWSVKCSVLVDDNGEYDFKYTKILFSDQNIRNRGIMAAPYVCSNPNAMRGVFRFVDEELQKKERGEDTVFNLYYEYRFQQGIIQAINKLGGVVELGAFTEQDFYDFLQDNRDVIKSYGDRKKERKERLAQMEAAGITLPKKSKNKKRKKRRR